MGFIINADIDTKLGPTNKMYIRIESFTFNKVMSELYFQITYWINEYESINFNKKILDDGDKNAEGLIGNKIILYQNKLDNIGESIELPLFIKTTPTIKKNIEIPIYKNKKIKKEIPYVSFDENGEEITAYRIVDEVVTEIVGYKKEVKDVIDNSLMENIYTFMYQKLHSELLNYFAEECIENSI